MPEYEKVYIGIYLFVDEEGNSRPVRIVWEDGRHFDIDKILNARMCPPKHVGAYLTKRYDCQVAGGVRSIYLETHSGRWFVEKLIRG